MKLHFIIPTKLKTACDRAGIVLPENTKVIESMQTEKPRPELLAMAEQCGAKLTGKPDGSEPITVVFTIEAWQRFDNKLFEQTKKLATYKTAYNEWADKTEFVQGLMNQGKLPARCLGMHRADILFEIVEAYLHGVHLGTS